MGALEGWSAASYWKSARPRSGSRSGGKAVRQPVRRGEIASAAAVGYGCAVFAPAPSIEPPPLPVTAPGVAVWRWWVHLLVIGVYPLLIGVIAMWRHGDGGPPALPTRTAALLLVCAVELALFGVIFGGAWMASRATGEELRLRWRGRVRPVLLGVVYSGAIRLALAVVAITVAVALLATQAMKPEDLQSFVGTHGPHVEKLVDAAALRHDPVYFWIMVTLVSFVVAGLREELWRAAFLAGMGGVFPGLTARRGGRIAAVAVAAVIFGLGHLQMGGMAVVLTGTIGLLLGLIMLLHGSIWEAVIAHGMFDATSFALIPWALEHLPKQVPVGAWPF